VVRKDGANESEAIVSESLNAQDLLLSLTIITTLTIRICYTPTYVLVLTMPDSISPFESYILNRDDSHSSHS
jgi:hypothetical protein